MSTKTKSTVETVAPERIDIRRVVLRIRGDSPLVVHAWSAKAKQMMLDKQMKRGTQAKEAKDPQRDYEESLYHLPGGGYGFPAIGIKASAVRGAKAIGLVMADMRGAFHISADLVRIEGAEPHRREDMVRIGMGTADIRYRGEFTGGEEFTVRGWYMDLPIRYNARAVSLEQLVAMLDAGGFGTGIGEFRPEKGGSWGMYHVEGTE